MPVGLDDLIDPFYPPIGPGFRATRTRGQIFFAPIGHTREDLQVWRPVAEDSSWTTATAFRLVAAPGDAFARHAPLTDPKLETNEELIGSWAKMRPVILLSPAPPPPSGVGIVRGGGRVHRRVAIVVPAYSLVNRLTGERKYRPEFTERMRLLEFFEFLYLPVCPGVLRFPSYARLNEMQAVYEPHLDPRDAHLAPDALGVLQGQIRYLTTGEYGGLLEVYRELLLHQGSQ